MVTRWGMSSKIGAISYSDRGSPFQGIGNAEFGNREYSEETAKTIDEEVHDIVESAYAQVVTLLTKYRPTLDRVAQELRRHEVIDNKQLMAILTETGVELDTAAPGAWDASEGDGLSSIPPAASNGSPPLT